MALAMAHANQLAPQQPRYAAPAAVCAPPFLAPPPPPPDPAAGVPVQAEDRRLDAHGNALVRKYTRGRLLGKVRLRAAERANRRGARARAS